LAAVAAAWASGLNPALIVRALSTFTTSTSMLPGRFNVSEIGGRQVILDYGHNAAAMRALGEAVVALGRRRTVLVLALPGARGGGRVLRRAHRRGAGGARLRPGRPGGAPAPDGRFTLAAGARETRMFTLIEGGEVHAPEPLGVQPLLLASERIVRIGPVDPAR